MLMTEEQKRAKQINKQKSCKTPFPLAYFCKRSYNDTTTSNIKTTNINNNKNQIYSEQSIERILPHTIQFQYDCFVRRKKMNENAMHCMTINYMQFAFNTQITFSASSNVCIMCKCSAYFKWKWSNHPKCVDYLCVRVCEIRAHTLAWVYVSCRSTHRMLFCLLYIVHIAQFISI